MSLLNQNYECPVCMEDNTIENNLEINELIECIICGSELEVQNTSPLLIIEAEMDAEDWGQ